MISIVENVHLQAVVLHDTKIHLQRRPGVFQPAQHRAERRLFLLTTLRGGVLEPIPVILVQMTANDANLGTVFSILFLMRTVCGSIFATTYLAIHNNKLPVEIASHVSPAALHTGLYSSSVPSLFSAVTNGTAAAQLALTDARVRSYSYIYYASTAVTSVGIVAAVCMNDMDHLLMSHVPRQVYKDGKGVETASEKDVDEKAVSEHEVVEVE